MTTAVSAETLERREQSTRFIIENGSCALDEKLLDHICLVRLIDLQNEIIPVPSIRSGN
jgi:hypothetical protein